MTPLAAAGYGAGAYLIVRFIAMLVKRGRGPEGRRIRVYPLTLFLWAFIAGGLVVMTGCGTDYSVCEFQPGQMVRSKVSGEVGQVISMRVPSRKRWEHVDWCYADVRFQGNQEYTDSRVLSNDGPINVRALTVVLNMRPYELEHVE